MSRVSLILISLTVMVSAIGLGVPWVVVHYMSNYGLSAWVGIPLAILAILAAGIIAVVGWGVMEDIIASMPTSSKEKILVEKINAYRARQRAMLEELDEIANLLREILKVLKVGGLHEETK